MSRSRSASRSRSILASSSTYSADVDNDSRDSDSSSTYTANSCPDAEKDQSGKEMSDTDSTVVASNPDSVARGQGKKDDRTSMDIEAASAEICAQAKSNVVHWAGDQDPENPKNFNQLVKLAIGLVIGMMNFIVSFAISVFSGILDEAGEPKVMTLGVSLFIMGLAFGPVFFGPASEYYGRKRPLVAGMIGFTAFTLFLATTNNIGAILICRLLAGFCGSAAYVVPPGMFVDLYGPVGRAVGYSIFASGAFIGGSLGPGVGATLVLHFDRNWHTPMLATALVALPMTAAMAFLPESLEPIILQRKAKRLRLQTENWSLRAKRDEVPVELRDYLLKPWRMLIREPVLMVVTAAFTLDYGIQSLTYSAVPQAFVRPRGWSFELSAWMLSITLGGFAIGCLVVVIDTKVRFGKRLLEGGPIAPEKRLPPIIVGMVILSIGLLFFAWKSSASTHWREQALAEILIGQGMYMVWVTATVYVQDLYTGHSNSALAACAFVRYAVGAMFPVFSEPMYDKLGIRWSIGLLGMLCAVLVPFHVWFYVQGKKIRSWSSFALHESVAP